MFTFARRELLGALFLAALLVAGLLLRFVLLPDKVPEIVLEQPAEPAEQQAAEEEKKIVVHVSGAVKNPGVYSLPDGSRVFEAIASAGGALPEANVHALNLAEVLFDGRKIIVPGVNLQEGGGQVVPPQDGRININHATAAELEELPGIGPARADAIVREREKNGPFRQVEDLARVSGIGSKTVEALRKYATVH
ncbi:MAG: ComEA family DNA-binding protein [Dethiobacter sp.]|nr:ComEA family DNA-binding protein [Dethiobacter sp.]MBS3898461.1 ComEA family DNA-binding protein [Dethiobacter sp.]MBS3983143.1 ComEA family DNA-binding protein [Dethiobacter sp.]